MRRITTRYARTTTRTRRIVTGNTPDTTGTRRIATGHTPDTAGTRQNVSGHTPYGMRTMESHREARRIIRSASVTDKRRSDSRAGDTETATGAGSVMLFLKRPA